MAMRLARAALLGFTLLPPSSSGGVATFSDASESAGLTHPGHGTGSSLGDIDDDGDIDLWIFNDGTVDDRLYRNNGLAHFEDVTFLAGVAGQPGAGGESDGPFVDFDNDGLPDAYVATIINPNSSRNLFYHNLDGLAFRERGSELGVSTSLDNRGVSWADLNDDGWLDFYVGSLPRTSTNRPYLYMNRPGPVFVDEWAERGLDFRGNGQSHIFWDWENDGDLDLFIGVYFDFTTQNMRNRIYRNNGTGHFSLADLLDVSPEATTGAQLADFDGDGLLDLFVLNERTPNELWRDNGDGTFTDIAASLGLLIPPFVLSGYPELKTGAAVGDFDNGMDLDLYVTNAHVLLGEEPRDHLMVNEGGLYVDRAVQAGITEEVNSWACAAGDLNGDGFLDIFVVNDNGFGTRPTLWLNNGNANHWFEIDPRGVISNRDAFGLQVWLTAGGVTQVQELYCFRTHPSRLHFGLGPNMKIDELVLRWPRGLVETYHDVPADQVFRPTEGMVVPFPNSGIGLH